MKYSNPAWEPYLKDISPMLSKIYFATDIGIIRRLVADLIFYKLSIIEKRNGI